MLDCRNIHYTQAAALLAVRWSPVVCGSLQTSGSHLAMKESIDLFANGNRAFEIGEMSTVFQRDQPGIWNCLGDVVCRSSGDEVVVA